jgi:hypothetical protein
LHNNENNSFTFYYLIITKSIKCNMQNEWMNKWEWRI